MHHFGLLVDVKRGRLVNNTTGLTVRCIATRSPLISPVVFQPTTNRYADTLKQCSDITRPMFRDNHIKHDITHHIQTQGQPVAARPNNNHIGENNNNNNNHNFILKLFRFCFCFVREIICEEHVLPPNFILYIRHISQYPRQDQC